MDCCLERKTIRTNEEKREFIIRMNRLIGQLNGIKSMIEEDKYCVDILTQLAASQAGIKSLSNLLIEKHIHNCVVNDLKAGKEESIDEVLTIMRRFQ